MASPTFHVTVQHTGTISHRSITYFTTEHIDDSQVSGYSKILVFAGGKVIHTVFPEDEWGAEELKTVEKLVRVV